MYKCLQECLQILLNLKRLWHLKLEDIIGTNPDYTDLLLQMVKILFEIFVGDNITSHGIWAQLAHGQSTHLKSYKSLFCASDPNKPDGIFVHFSFGGTFNHVTLYTKSDSIFK